MSHIPLNFLLCFCFKQYIEQWGWLASPCPQRTTSDPRVDTCSILTLGWSAPKTDCYRDTRIQLGIQSALSSLCYGKVGFLYFQQKVDSDVYDGYRENSWVMTSDEDESFSHLCYPLNSVYREEAQVQLGREFHVLSVGKRCVLEKTVGSSSHRGFQSNIPALCVCWYVCCMSLCLFWSSWVTFALCLSSLVFLYEKCQKREHLQVSQVERYFQIQEAVSGPEQNLGRELQISRDGNRNQSPRKVQGSEKQFSEFWVCILILPLEISATTAVKCLG